MSRWKVTQFVVVTVLIFGAHVAPVAAQVSSGRSRPRSRYRFIDLGTFGGPDSAETVEFPFINEKGVVVGFADTDIPDPNSPNCFTPQCVITHGFRWVKGELTDLGTLPNGVNSFAIWANNHGDTVGLSQNGLVDPLLGIPAAVGVLWGKGGETIDIGTLGGNESLAGAINGRRQVVGAAANGVPDDFSFFGWGTQTRAFLWEDGVIRDLGTLGGSDAVAAFINERGQVAGDSYTGDQPSPSCFPLGFPVPLATGAFLWDKGRMLNLGGLGGTCTFVVGLNNRGEVAGQSNLAGDLTTHPFLWRPRSHPHLTDLRTLGGTFGVATSVNERGHVVGGATTANDEAFHAFFWRDGLMKDLGTIDDDTCSVAHFMNALGQVVGTSGDCAGTFELHGFLWQKGGPMLDLNQFVPLGSDLVITDGETINDRGDIAGSGMLPNGNFHAVVLIACGEAQPADGCREAGEDVNVRATKMRSAQQRLAATRHQLSLNDVRRFVGNRASVVRRRAQ